MLMSVGSSIALAVILLIATQQQQQLGAEAKSLNQNQVKFRRLPPKEFSAALGSSITIECEAGASPPPTIHWLKDGKRIYLNDMESNQLEDFEQLGAPVDDVNRIALSATRSRLYIDCADVSDEATYTCVAENAFTRISSHTKLNLIRPAVQLAASSAEAPPAMGGDGNDLSQSGLGGGGGASANGQQQATGGSGNIDLALTAVPQCLSERLANGGAAPQAPVRIHMWTHNIVEIMKNNVIIYCRSNANNQQQQQQRQTVTSKSQLVDDLAQATRKPATTVWTLPDDKLVSEEMRDKFEVLETGDLLIKDLRWADMGSYVCTVSDDRSSDSISTFVYPAAVKVNSKRSAATNWEFSSNIG